MRWSSIISICIVMRRGAERLLSNRPARGNHVALRISRRFGTPDRGADRHATVSLCLPTVCLSPPTSEGSAMFRRKGRCFLILMLRTISPGGLDLPAVRRSVAAWGALMEMVALDAGLASHSGHTKFPRWPAAACCPGPRAGSAAGADAAG